MKVPWFLSANEFSHNLKDHVRSLRPSAHHKPGRFAGKPKEKAKQPFLGNFVVPFEEGPRPAI